MDEIAEKEHRAAAAKAMRIVSTYESNYDKIMCNAYESGTVPDVDEAIDRIGQVEAFLRQEREEITQMSQTVEQLRESVGM